MTVVEIIKHALIVVVTICAGVYWLRAVREARKEK